MSNGFFIPISFPFPVKDKKSKVTPSIPESGIFNIEVCFDSLSLTYARFFANKLSSRLCRRVAKFLK